MNEFSISVFTERDFPYNFVISETFRKYDILTPRYKTVKIVFNGDDWGLMLLEEQFHDSFYAFNEIKEGSDAAIAQLKKVVENISKVEELDLHNIEKVIQKKVTEIIFDLTGKIIKELPSEFIKKIKSLLSQLENIEGNIDIFINEEDHKVIESNKSIKNEIKKLSLYSSKELQHGEIELKVNGISIRKTIK